MTANEPDAVYQEQKLKVDMRETQIELLNLINGLSDKYFTFLKEGL